MAVTHWEQCVFSHQRIAVSKRLMALVYLWGYLIFRSWWLPIILTESQSISRHVSLAVKKKKKKAQASFLKFLLLWDKRNCIPLIAVGNLYIDLNAALEHQRCPPSWLSTFQEVILICCQKALNALEKPGMQLPLWKIDASNYNNHHCTYHIAVYNWRFLVWFFFFIISYIFKSVRKQR